MFRLDLKSKKSIYEQIIDGYKELIIRGELKTDEKLPSVRELSELLTVNPNTVQKAYRALEQQGWIYVVAGRGNFVAGFVHAADPQKVAEIRASIGAMLDELSYLETSEKEICDLVQGLIEERGKKK